MFESEKKSLNFFRVLRSIWQTEGISRVALSRRIGLDKSTVSLIVKELIKMGIVETYRLSEDAAVIGRKPIGLRVSSRFGFVLGINAQPDIYTVVALDLAGREIYREQATPESDRLVPGVTTIVERVLAAGALDQMCLVGLGVSLSGIVDSEAGVVALSFPFEQDAVEKVSVGRALTERFGIPVMVDNDANCCAWGVLTERKNEDIRNFLFVLIEAHKRRADSARYDGVGIGIGIGIDGKVYGGTRQAAGEFRSVFAGPVKSSQFSLSREESFRVTEDDALFDRFVHELARNIALLANTFDMSHVFVDGNVNDRQAVIGTAFESAIQENWAYESARESRVEFTLRGEYAAAIGAGSMFLQRLFLEPEYGTDLAGMNRWLRSVVRAGSRTRIADRDGAIETA